MAPGSDAPLPAKPKAVPYAACLNVWMCLVHAGRIHGGVDGYPPMQTLERSHIPYKCIMEWGKADEQFRAETD